MATHEFGMMQNAPINNERFDEYEPNKYHCIVIDDDFIEPILIHLQNVPCYWHTLQNKGDGRYTERNEGVQNDRNTGYAADCQTAGHQKEKDSAGG